MVLSAETRDVLYRYDWPGNAREVRNAMEYAVLVAQGCEIRPEHLPGAIASCARSGSAAEGTSLRDRLLRVERETLFEAMQRARGVKKEAARLLGIDPRNMNYFLRKHGIGRAGP